MAQTPEASGAKVSAYRRRALARIPTLAGLAGDEHRRIQHRSSRFERRPADAPGPGGSGAGQGRARLGAVGSVPAGLSIVEGARSLISPEL